MALILRRIASIAKMPVPVWISLFVLLVVTTLGTFHLFRRVRALLRAFKTFGGAMDGVLHELTGSLDRLSRNAESFGSATPRLDASLGRLQVSLARAAVLRAAVQDARDSLGRLAAVYPCK
jgi:hypothetical protein